MEKWIGPPHWRANRQIFPLCLISPFVPTLELAGWCCWCDAGMLSGCQVGDPWPLLRGANEVLVSTCSAAVTQLFLNNPPICLPLLWPGPAATRRPAPSSPAIEHLPFYWPTIQFVQLDCTFHQIIIGQSAGITAINEYCNKCSPHTKLSALSALHNICSAVNSKLHSPQWTIACRKDG